MPGPGAMQRACFAIALLPSVACGVGIYGGNSSFFGEQSTCLPFSDTAMQTLPRGGVNASLVNVEADFCDGDGSNGRYRGTIVSLTQTYDVCGFDSSSLGDRVASSYELALRAEVAAAVYFMEAANEKLRVPGMITAAYVMHAS